MEINFIILLLYDKYLFLKLDVYIYRNWIGLIHYSESYNMAYLGIHRTYYHRNVFHI